MKKFLFLAVLLTVPAIASAWSLRTDPHSPAEPVQPSHCGFYFDAAPKVVRAVDTEAGGVYCLLDLSTVTLANGTHTVKATHIVDHPVSPAESDFSNTVTFTWPIPAAPGTPGAPSVLKLVP